MSKSMVAPEIRGGMLTDNVDLSADSNSNQNHVRTASEDVTTTMVIDKLTGMCVPSDTASNNQTMLNNENDIKSQEQQPQFYYRSSVPLRRLKKPQPQPHICIRDRTEDGHDLYINVLSWGKLNKPKDATEPIQLYGGMRVEFLNQNYKKLLIYAVAANPEVLEKTKRTTGNSQSQYALMVLMSQYVEAMNPGLKLRK